MTSLLPVLLLLLLPQTILSQSGHYIPLGHGQCHDASFHHYPSLRRVHSPDHEEYLNILSLPHSSGSDISSSSHSSTNEIEETIQQINQITNCPIKCGTLAHHPQYRGYEIVVGRGCYCLMDSSFNNNHDDDDDDVNIHTNI